MNRLSRQYPVTIWWSDEDECYIAEAPDLPGCNADGLTREKAAWSIDDAIISWIATAQGTGKPIPAPGSSK